MQTLTFIMPFLQVIGHCGDGSAALPLPAAVSFFAVVVAAFLSSPFRPSFFVAKGKGKGAVVPLLPQFFFGSKQAVRIFFPAWDQNRRRNELNLLISERG